MDRIAKASILGNLVTLEIVAYRTIQEIMTHAQAMSEIEVFDNKYLSNMRYYMALMMSCIQSVEFHDDDCYVDTVEPTLLTEIENRIQELQDDEEGNHEVIAKLEQQREEVVSEERREYRRLHAIYARDSFRHYWENQNGDIKHNWELFCNTHENVGLEFMNAYSQTRLQLPKGNPVLSSKPDVHSMDAKEKKST